jgi:hypothetical protein
VLSNTFHIEKKLNKLKIKQENVKKKREKKKKRKRNPYRIHTIERKQSKAKKKSFT